MSDTDRSFAGSIPALYHRHLGPLLFEPYAADLAARLDGLHGRVLEIAAGTGIATRALERVLGDGAAIVATDLNPAMLEHAASLGGTGRISWRQADAQALAFDDASFDAVVCQFGAMFFPDKVAAYSHARRVLRPGGRYVFSVWDDLRENQVAAVVAEAVAELFPDDPPNFLARTPYGYHDKDRLRRHLHSAGFDRVDIDTVAVTGRAPSAVDPAIGLCQGSPLRNEIEARAPNRLAEVTERATQAVARRFGSGPISSTLRAHVVTAHR